MSDTDHGKSQARAQYESIAEMVNALDQEKWDRYEELKEERERLASDLEEEDQTEEQHQQASGDLAVFDAAHGDELATLEKELDGYDDADDARQRIEEGPLSVEVRSGWVSPGEDMEAEEFCILLCTGGPAARIRGELDQYGQPDRAWLEYQDWGTPWTQYFDADQETLLSYCRCFHFGQ